ncbi:MAG TPA: cbb3-type cytochrome c oxidase subunit I [Candidatus Dormibacteraeota bacterium]|nr:cbb3-type cytochrome c oxidase subunit I [Candidatus Dormibacteraeota bacterium]
MNALTLEERGISSRVMWLYLGTGLAVFALMAVLGLTMRMAQATWISLDPTMFYAIMTLHGAGMITSMALCGMGGLWSLMYREHRMRPSVAYWAYGLVVAGVVAVLLSVFPGKFGAGWTFLYPLPFIGATWPSWATGLFLIGIALVTAGWIVWCIQMFGCVVSAYGGLRGALAWDLVFHPKEFAASGREAPPPQAFAALVASVDGLLAGAAGMLIGVALIVRWLSPSTVLDPLWAKNLTFFFGHTFANLTIYMAIAFVYVGLPRYVDREWHTSQVLAVAWWGTLLFVATAYFHHLYMDFVQPRSVQYVGEVASYLAAFPPAIVTVFGGVLLVYRSRMRWTLGSLFMYAGMAGWIVGGFGAVLDATIPINSILHNTLWVPAHFHTYLLEGVLLFVLGWVFHNLEERSGAATSALVRWIAGLGIFGGGAIFLLGFYVGGADGVPRRYAMQPPPGPEISAWASTGAIILLAGLVVVLVEGIRLARKRAASAA